MIVQRLVRAAAYQLQDIDPGDSKYDHTRWSVRWLLEYLNQGLNMLATLRPALFHVTQTVELVPGAVQTIPADFVKLVDVGSNVNSDGSLGAPVLISDFKLHRVFPSNICAPRATENAAVVSVTQNPNTPRLFSVNPPVMSAPPQRMQLIGQIRSPVITAENQDLELPGGGVDAYYNFLLDWMLYRAFMADTESKSSLQRAQMHYAAAYQGAGMQAQAQGAPQQRRGAANAQAN